MARTPVPTVRKPDLDRALRSLFKGVEVRALPERLRSVVEQLEAQAAKPQP